MNQASTLPAKYIAIYKILGANSLAADADKLTLHQDANLVASLTSDPAPHLEHIVKAAALASELSSGLFNPRRKGTAEERLVDTIKEIKRQKLETAGSGVFLVLHGQTVIPTPDFKARRDLSTCSVSLDDIDKSKIRETFLPIVKTLIAALSLAMRSNLEPKVQHLGDVIYLLDPISQNPIYPFSFQFGSPRLSVASPLTKDAIAEAVAIGSRLLNADKTLARVVQLLITSLRDTTDQLEAFIAAWAALEIFVTSTFKTTYEARWLQVMSSGTPESSKPVFRRLQEVMRDKYRLADKFLIIASVLDPMSATTDVTEFTRLKDIRDDLFHGKEAPSALQSTDAVQALLRKMLKLHVLTNA